MASELDKPFTIPEIYQAILAGGQNRAPGRDGIGLEFYKCTWEFIKEDTMFFENTITAQQKAGAIILLPKNKPTVHPTDRRPVTLLNTDIKIVSRILARRLRPIVEEHHKTTQYCGVHG